MLRSNIARYYLRILAEIALVVAVAAIGIYPFIGPAHIADALHNVLFVLLLLCFRRDKNLLTILLIILIGRLFNEAMWFIDSQGLAIKLVLYISAGWLFYSLRYDKLAKFSLSLLFCMVSAELYWWAIEYDRTPIITYHAAILIENVVVRHLIYIRPDVFGFYSKSLRRISIDRKLYNLTGLFTLTVATLVVEYFLRHITNFKILTIYNAYPYIMAAIYSAILWVILNYALKKTALFQA